MLEKGTQAPEFVLMDKDGKEVSLSDFAGKKVVLYFYPKDNTPGCTKQACGFAGMYDEFIEMDAAVIGVSKDSSASHQRFADKYNLPVIDENGIIEEVMPKVKTDTNAADVLNYLRKQQRLL